MAATAFCALCTLQHDYKFDRGEVDKPGAMARVRNGAAEAEHREVSVSLPLSNKKVSLGRKLCTD